jgi:hypothetical protein
MPEVIIGHALHGKGLNMRVYRLMFLAGLALVPCQTAFSQQTEQREAAGMVAGWCRAIASVVERPDHSFPMPRDAETHFCWGAFAAIQQLAWLEDPRTHMMVLQVCAPKESSRLQFIRIFRRYVSDHPELEHLDFAAVAQNALAQSFPCKNVK